MTNGKNDNSFLKIFAAIGKRFGAQMIAGLVFACSFLLFFGWLAEEVFEGDTRIFDETIRNFVHERSSPALTSAMIFFSFLGSPLFLIILGILIVAAFSYLGHRRAIILFLITMAGEIFLEFSLKQFFGRVRPEAFFDYPLPLSYSFPSGHAFGSLCFYGIVTLLTAERMKSKPIKITVCILSALLIFLIGFSRIYLGVHYPSDVVAGFLAGFFWIGIIALTDAHRRRQNSKSNF